MSHAKSLVLRGADGLALDIECKISRGLPAFIIVGSASRAVTEAKERVRAAFTACRIGLPPQRIVINLAPAGVPKDGTSLDLAIAASILLKVYPQARLERSLLFGELGLDGSVRPVRGIIGNILAGRKQGYKTFYVPARQLQQAKLVPQVVLVPIDSLVELKQHLVDKLPLVRQSTTASRRPLPLAKSPEFDLNQITGQQQAKRALEIAAAGGHNLLLNGPPGSGKSLLAKALPSILPPLRYEEVLEATHIYSLMNQAYDQLILQRPVRAPHHTISITAMIGGGQPTRPGEISLAHQGVLLLDELPEFSRPVLEALRQPLENQTITLNCGHDQLSFPANFILVATANPCPCGFYGTALPCQCHPHSRERYRQKLSGPLLDRIDLYLDVAALDTSQLLSTKSSEEPSSAVLKRVQQARHHQQERYASGRLNASMANREIHAFISLEPDAKSLLDSAAQQFGLSARAYMRCLKVARTIADLAGTQAVNSEHISEALQYRKRQNP